MKSLTGVLNLLIQQWPTIKAAGGEIDMDAVRAAAKEEGSSDLLVAELEYVTQGKT